MTENGPQRAKELSRLLQTSPVKFVCAWSQEPTLQFCRMHDHAVMELVYHPSGHGTTRLADGTTLTYEEGGVVCYSASVAHDQTPIRPGSDVCVHVQIPRRAAPFFPKAISHSAFFDPYVGEEFWSLSRTPPHPGEALGTVLNHRVTALLLYIHVVAGRGEPLPDPQAAYLRRAKQYLQNNFATIPNSGAVAKHVGISTDYLRHLFQQREGLTLNQVLTRVRIERAMELLRHSPLPLKAVAEQCGFQNERYFSTRFVDLVGTTPRAFRIQPHGHAPPPLRNSP